MLSTLQGISVLAADVSSSIKSTDSVSSDEIFAGGDGTTENPYLIETAEQLDRIRDDLTAHYKLIADIDLSSVERWEKIGSTTNHFSGYLNGNNFKICNLSIKDSTVGLSNTNVGLFSYIENAVIENLIIENVDIEVYTENIGAIAGTAKNSTVRECNISGFVYGIGDYGHYTGGVIGQNISGKIQGVTFIGGVEGENYSGAIAALNSGNIEVCNSFPAENYKSIGAYYPGGIVGNNSGKVIFCKNSIDIHGNRWGGTRTGGIVAQNFGTIERCCNSGRISSVDYPSGNGNVGGVCGLNNGTIKNCYNAGEVVSDRASVYGISANGTIENCYNVGLLDGGKDYTDGTYEYGISKKDNATNCYYIDTVIEAGGGIRLSESKMCQQSSYFGFDFNKIWTISESETGYPQLQEYDFKQYEKDTDGDGLLDIWETDGIDTDGDGEIDLHIERMGADPNIPDIFVEVDWMVRPQKKILWITTQEELSLAPSQNALRNVYQVFKNHGINIHIDAGASSTDFVTGKSWGELSGGNVIPYEKNFSLGRNYEHWNDVVDSNFTSNRKKVFRHAMFINTYNGKTSSGIANDIPGQHFIIANQEWVRNTGDKGVAGTFMHELGHTLGLSHGGFDDNGKNDHINDKPNYLSIMNYLFQTTGLAGTENINYSDYDLPAIDENAIDEKDGIDPGRLTAGTGLGTKLKGNSTIFSNISGRSIDFNSSGSIDSESLSLDLNNDGRRTVLYSSNDWNHIVYAGGSIGDSGESLQNTSFSKPNNTEFDFSELTLEEALENKVVSSIGTGALNAIGPFTLLSNSTEQNVYLRVTNMGSEKATFSLKIEDSSLCNGFSREVSITASKEELKYIDIAIPITNSLSEGNYTITAVLSYPGKEDISIKIPVSIYAPTAEEIQKLKEELKKEDVAKEIPVSVLHEYSNIINQTSEYQINYNLDGGTVSGNPLSYTKETETFTLLNPTKEGWTFIGWTGSNGNIPQISVTINKGTMENLSYTANWKQITPSPSPSQAPPVTPLPSSSQSPSDTGNIFGGGVATIFTPAPSPTVTMISSPLPSLAATLTPSATPVTIVTVEPVATLTPVPSNSSNPDNSGDNYNTDTAHKISDVATVTLGKKTFVYNGKAKKPKITVSKDDSKLIKNTDYTVSYYKNTKVGTASVIINGIGNYSGSINKTFKIIPKEISIKGKLKPQHKGFIVKWKKQSKSITGYQVQYSTNKKFNGKITIKTVTKKTVTKLRVNKLKAKKKYYVRVRTYKTVKGKEYRSKWSKVKTVTTKK